MILYRVTSSKYINRWTDALSGEGSFRGGGRWSSVGTRMVYSSTTLSLAALEVLVHCNKQNYLASRIMIRFSLLDQFIQELALQNLSPDWKSIPESVVTQRLGDSFIQTSSALGLIVPSATLPTTNVEERNVLLNPNTELLSHLEQIEIEPFHLDQRIQKLIQS